MGIGITFIIIAVIVVFILQANNHFNSRKFVKDTEPYFRFLMEDDYEFLLNIRYGEVDVNKLFSTRVRDGLIAIVAMFFIFMQNISFVYVLLSIIIGFGVFKYPYIKLKNYYLLFCFSLFFFTESTLNIIANIIKNAIQNREKILLDQREKQIFKPGLKDLIAKIDAGDSSVQPYMDFANRYPVRDSMRMMRLLYRLGLGSQENKQEQLLMFSRTISTLQNKAREQKYKERLEKMENRTMIMLFGTGGGILGFMMLSMMMMLSY